ncbi:hypothetical protein [Lachnoclostridium sp.]|uniref:hypothetical protein n=1 Tax=Lachnoclostridium sp. TaxID=2028282 RepID=UPI00289C9F0E|nr:hypothetical protein [Lachnoclostridium sp.]
MRIENKLKRLDQIFKRKIPLEYIEEGQVKTKYNKGYERYQALKNEISMYSPDEIEYVRLKFKGNIESMKRLWDYTNILPLASGIFAIVFSIVSDVKDLKVMLLYYALIVGIMLLTVYSVFAILASRNIHKYEYYLQIVDLVTKERETE